MKTLAEAIESARRENRNPFPAAVTESCHRDTPDKKFYHFRYDQKGVMKVGDKFDDGAGYTATVMEIIFPTGVFIAANRATSRFTIVSEFSCWEEFQGAFRCGIILPDGTQANFISHACDAATAIRVMSGRNFKLCEELVTA